jgi:DNA invertase Pin-like site-specific DNA recombinase
MGDVIGYARVSTTDQQSNLQADALAAAGCLRVFIDTASGVAAERPELGRCFDHLSPTVMTAEKLAVARQMYASREHVMDAIAKAVGVGRAALYRHLAP